MDQVVLWHRIVGIYVHEIGLYGIKTCSISPGRAEILIDCVVSAQEYLDAVLAFTKENMGIWPTFLLSPLHYSFTIVMKLTLGIRSANWSVEDVRKRIKLEFYIDKICERLRRHEDVYLQNFQLYNWREFLISKWKTLKTHYAEGLRNYGIHIFDHSEGLPPAPAPATDPGREDDFRLADGAGLPAFIDLDFGDFLTVDDSWLMSHFN